MDAAELKVAELKVAELKVAELKVAELKVAELKVAKLKVADIKIKRWLVMSLSEVVSTQLVKEVISSLNRGCGVRRDQTTRGSIEST